jgi:hypothetical protein
VEPARRVCRGTDECSQPSRLSRLPAGADVVPEISESSCVPVPLSRVLSKARVTESLSRNRPRLDGILHLEPFDGSGLGCKRTLRCVDQPASTTSFLGRRRRPSLLLWGWWRPGDPECLPRLVANGMSSSLLVWLVLAHERQGRVDADLENEGFVVRRWTGMNLHAIRR